MSNLVVVQKMSLHKMTKVVSAELRLTKEVSQKFIMFGLKQKFKHF